jgi:RNA polymerase sigma-70 factor (ECF subfamily)
MPSGDGALERGLWRAALAGDEQAWRAWYEASFAPLYAYTLWRCAGLRDVADEIVQETWLTVVRRLREFDPERADFAAWLRGIAAARAESVKAVESLLTRARQALREALGSESSFKAADI